MAYHLDLSGLSLMEYKELLRCQNLLPGRRMLWDNIDRNFEAISRQKIGNIAQLKKHLSTQQKIKSFAITTGIAEAYLILLKREIGSLVQRPVSIADFPDMDSEMILSLNDKGIINSKEYFDSGPAKTDELFCLCDLVRINGVGPLAAKAFYEAGYRSVKEVAFAEAREMLTRVTEVNDTKRYYKTKLGVKDMQFCIDYAAVLIRYNG